MIRESEVRQKLAAVARHALPLEDFSEWIDEESWNMHRDSSPAAIDLVSSIHALLAERDARAINDKALRRELLSLLNNVRVVLDDIGGSSAGPLVRPAASTAQWVRPSQAWTLPASA